MYVSEQTTIPLPDTCDTTDSTEHIKNTFSTNDLISVKNDIEALNNFNQIEILRILTSHGTSHINENKNGIHVNITELNQKTLVNIQQYISYIKQQECDISKDEKQKEDIKNIYFSKNI